MLPGIHIDSIQEVVRGSSGVSPSKRNCININTLGIWKNDPLCPGKSTPIPFRGRYHGVCGAAESICDGVAVRTVNTLIGSPIERLEDLRFLRGRGGYVDDLTRAGLGRPAGPGSSGAHGRLRAIDL